MVHLDDLCNTQRSFLLSLILKWFSVFEKQKQKRWGQPGLNSKISFLSYLWCFKLDGDRISDKAHGLYSSAWPALQNPSGKVPLKSTRKFQRLPMMKRKWIDLIGSASSVSSFRLNVTSLQKPFLTTPLLFFTRPSYFFHSTQPLLNACFPFSLPKVEALPHQGPCQSYHFCIPYTLHSEEWGTDPKWRGEWMNELLKCYVAP